MCMCDMRFDICYLALNVNVLSVWRSEFKCLCLILFVCLWLYEFVTLCLWLSLCVWMCKCLCVFVCVCVVLAVSLCVCVWICFGVNCRSNNTKGFCLPGTWYWFYVYYFNPLPPNQYVYVNLFVLNIRGPSIKYCNISGSNINAPGSSGNR